MRCKIQHLLKRWPPPALKIGVWNWNWAKLLTSHDGELHLLPVVENAVAGWNGHSEDLEVASSVKRFGHDSECFVTHILGELPRDDRRVDKFAAFLALAPVCTKEPIYKNRFWCLDQSPRGAPHKESISPQTRLIGFTAHAYLSKRLSLLRSPHIPPSRLAFYAPLTRAHFAPQHWLQCHLVSY